MCVCHADFAVDFMYVQHTFIAVLKIILIQTAREGSKRKTQRQKLDTLIFILLLQKKKKKKKKKKRKKDKKKKKDNSTSGLELDYGEPEMKRFYK